MQVRPGAEAATGRGTGAETGMDNCGEVQGCVGYRAGCECVCVCVCTCVHVRSLYSQTTVAEYPDCQPFIVSRGMM